VLEAEDTLLVLVEGGHVEVRTLLETVSHSDEARHEMLTHCEAQSPAATAYNDSAPPCQSR
jgi:hypothetical protein